VKPGTRFTLDVAARRTGSVVIGGSPLRLVRLGSAGTRMLDDWTSGSPLTESPGQIRLARKLVDAGILHPKPPAGATAADVTVVVPVKDDATRLPRLLEATAECDARIVVDDGSREPVPDATVRHDEPKGPAAARNAGWRAARTEFVAFLDADTVPEPGWLQSLLPHFSDPSVVAVAPRVRSSPGDGLLADYELEQSSLDLGTNPAPVRPMSKVSYVPTAALVVRRGALVAAGGFDEDLRYGEDVDLVWRLLDVGAVRYEPASIVRHAPRPTLRAWLRQRFDYGTSAAPLSERHPERLAPARVSAWTTAAWALAALGRPLPAAAVAAGATALLSRRLSTSTRDVPTAEVVRLAARGQLGAGRLLAAASRRVWWPLLLPTRRGRRVLAAAYTPFAVQTASPGRLALRIADDVAYGAGVWTGCVRHRTATPLLPQFTERPFAQGRGR